MGLAHQNIALAIRHTLKRFLQQILQGYWVDVGTFELSFKEVCKCLPFWTEVLPGIYLPFYQMPYNPLVFNRSMIILGVEDRSKVLRQFQTPPGPGFICALVLPVLSLWLERFNLAYSHVHFMDSA